MNTHMGTLTYPDGSPLIPGPLTLFTHISDKGVIRHWHIDKMMEVAKELDVVMVELDPEFVPFIHARRGIEQHRLNRIQPADLTYPVIFVEMEGETPEEPPISHLLVDGNHRYVRACEWGHKEIRAVIFPKELSDLCLVIGLPTITKDTVLTMQSGIV